MTLIAEWGAVIAKLGTAVAGDLKLTLEVVNPAANERGRIRRKILL